ncbi:MAG: VOC family protein [Acidobacteriota bacterium]|nr:VOC family protein [Acidobacteriota bacterium]
MANPFVHLELNTRNLQQSKDFYGQLFGWQFQDIDMGPMGTYSTFQCDSGPGGGMTASTGAPVGWLAYIGVADVKATTEQAVALGATVLHGPAEVPGIGWMTIFHDPAGAGIAIFQASQPVPAQP